MARGAPEVDDAASRPADGAPRPEKAFELTDQQGHRALARWRADGWLVESDDPALRRRVQDSLRRPIWVREDAVDEFGVRNSYLVEL